MSHTVTVIMHADQVIEILGDGIRIDVNNIRAIEVNSQGVITNALITQQTPPTQWIKEKK